MLIKHESLSLSPFFQMSSWRRPVKRIRLTPSEEKQIRPTTKRSIANPSSLSVLQYSGLHNPYLVLMSRWVANPVHVRMFQAMSYEARCKHVCTEKCDILCDPKLAKGVYLCSQSGRVHTCSDTDETCSLQTETADGHCVCPITGRILLNSSILSDAGHFFNGTVSSEGAVMTTDIAASRFWERDEQKQDAVRQRLVTLCSRAEVVVEHLLFSPTRTELRNRYRDSICRNIAETIESHVRKCIPSHRFVDLTWVHTLLTIKLVNDLRKLRAYSIPNTTDTLIKSKIASTAAYLWILFQKHFVDRIKARKYKYEYGLHVQIVLFCMIEGIAPYGLKSLEGLECIAPLESDVDRFGYTKLMFTRGEGDFRSMLAACHDRNYFTSWYVFLFSFFFFFSLYCCVCVCS